MTNQGKGAIDIVLAESFKELAVQKPIEKITIKEITDKAGVIRPTFYNHFQDKYELLEWIVQDELIRPLQELISDGMFKEGVIRALKNMQKEKGFYTSAAKLEGQNSFPEILKSEISKLLMDQVCVESVNAEIPYNWLTPKRVADSYAEFMDFIIVDWVKDGMAIPAEELVDTVLFLLSHSTIDLFAKVWKKK